MTKGGALAALALGSVCGLTLGCAASAVARGAAAGAIARGLAGPAAGRALASVAGRGALAASAGRAAAGVAARGALRGALLEITAAGRLRPTLSIDRVGRISHAGRHLATLSKDGQILAEGVHGSRQLIGRLWNGRIWEVDGTGSLLAPIGRVSGVTVGRGVRLYSGPSPRFSTIEILRPQVTVEVLQMSDGWFLVRLAGARTGWVWGPLLGISTALALDDEDDRLGDGSGDSVIVEVSSGQSLWAERFEWKPELIELSLPGGAEALIDDELIESVEPARSVLDWDWGARVPRLHLVDGRALAIERARETRGLAEVVLVSGERLVLDPLLVASADWSG